MGRQWELPLEPEVTPYCPVCNQAMKVGDEICAKATQDERGELVTEVVHLECAKELGWVE